MGRNKKLTVKEVVEALEQTHGLKTGAAEMLGVTFNTLERYVQDSPTAQMIVRFWRERRKDRAEYKLDEAIERGDPWAIMFTLKNAKGREYNDRLGLDLPENTNVTLSWRTLDDKENQEDQGD